LQPSTPHTRSISTVSISCSSSYCTSKGNVLPSVLRHELYGGNGERVGTREAYYKRTRMSYYKRSHMSYYCGSHMCWASTPAIVGSTCTGTAKFYPTSSNVQRERKLGLVCDID
jgi:hypothetical protein